MIPHHRKACGNSMLKRPSSARMASDGFRAVRLMRTIKLAASMRSKIGYYLDELLARVCTSSNLTKLEEVVVQRRRLPEETIWPV